MDMNIDLRLSQIKAIAAFNENRPFCMNELANNSMVKLPNMTTMVNSLIKDGFAERLGKSSDRRKVMVCLTPMGEKIRAQFLANRRKTALSIFSNLNEKEKKELITALNKVCILLEKSISSDLNKK
jgi:DNA-binding MarR family transcriptional regulator